MNDSQAALPGMPPRPRREAAWAADFKHLPQGVMPTTLHTLRAGTSILHVTYVTNRQDVRLERLPRGKSRLLRLLHRLGSWSIDCPGSVTVFVVTGSNEGQMRDLTVVDHQGEHPPARVSSEELARMIGDWFSTWDS